VESGADGLYTIPLLSPGLYDISVSRTGYTTATVAGQRLAVASTLQINVELRLVTDQWGTENGRFFTTSDGRLIHYYADDLDELGKAVTAPLDARAVNLNATLSYFVGYEELNRFPLAGRDAYALLVALPGVTADNATARGLGFSVNGQRPSASNFLLDGLENNNDLITGNLTTISPEALEEYRISTNNFSAEYGHTSGFVANAITRSGGSEWHGAGYFYMKNDALNANGYRNPPRPGLVLNRLPLKQLQPGFQAGGPLIKERHFASLAFEYLRVHSYRD